MSDIRIRRRFRHRRVRHWLAAAGLLLLASPAFAGGLFRCSGKNGELAYTNRPAGYVNCTQVSSYADPPPKAPVATAATAAPASSPGAAIPERTAAKQPAQWQYSDAPGDKAPAVAAAGSATTPAAAENKPENKVLRGAVYKVSKAHGITEYTNIRPSGRKYQVLFTYISNCYACDVRSKVNFTTTRLNRDAYRAEIAAAAIEFGVEESLLRAVVHAESAFNPNALSNKGAQGLMQLMPGTADDMGVDNPFDATENIRGGAQYLAYLLKNFQGDERLAVAAYNAGPGNVQKYGGVPPFDETRVYVSRVHTLRDRYRETSL